MTLEEIKDQYTMADIVARYGFQADRKGFIQCPFHQGDRQASLKLYPKDFHCFGCGANGDVITFVEMMEGVPFREAFQILGGTYEKPSFSSRLAIYRAEKQRQTRLREAERLEDRKKVNNTLISVYRAYMEASEPLSDVWCDCYNALQYQLHVHSELTGIPF